MRVNRMGYVQREDEWFEVGDRHKTACCDCGLVHLLEFRVRKGKIQMRAIRDNRATAARRRAKGIRHPLKTEE